MSFSDSAVTVFGMTELHTQTKHNSYVPRGPAQVCFAEVWLSVHLVNNGAHVNIHQSPVETHTPNVHVTVHRNKFLCNKTN